jgi:3-hydroxyisobutyrate dehydrogenase-like beta-hydroxyacid dehydrogenase
MVQRRVGFIGLGGMGKPMAKRLLGHGWEVVSCVHLRRETLEELRPMGLIEAASPQAVAEQTNIVITMVRDAQESDVVILGSEGVLGRMSRDTTLVIMSTLSPGFCERVAARATGRGVAVLDAPVSGWPARAAEGTLALLVGGEAAVLERCRPLLETFGRILPCGPVGTGMAVKLASNAVALGTVALLIEGRALARAYGVSEDRLMEIFTQTAADSFMVQHWETIWGPLSELGLKDLHTSLEAAHQRGVDLPFITAASQHDWRRSS